MKLRNAKRKDLKEIGKLMIEEFSNPPYNEKESIKDVMKSLVYYYNRSKMVVLTKKKILGVIVFEVEQWWEGKVLVIIDLAIKRDNHKEGFGKELINYAEIFSKRNKIKKIVFQTNKKSKAVKFYKKLGYKINNSIISMEKKI